MQIHGPASVHGPQPINPPHSTAAPKPIAPTTQIDPAAELDISQEADLVSRAREMPDVRAARIAEIRRSIQAGTYETDEKLEIALDRMMDGFGG